MHQELVDGDCAARSRVREPEVEHGEPVRANPGAGALLTLQRSAGNKATRSLLAGGRFHTPGLAVARGIEDGKGPDTSTPKTIPGNQNPGGTNPSTQTPTNPSVVQIVNEFEQQRQQELAPGKAPEKGTEADTAKVTLLLENEARSTGASREAVEERKKEFQEIVFHFNEEADVVAAIPEELRKGEGPSEPEDEERDTPSNPVGLVDDLERQDALEHSEAVTFHEEPEDEGRESPSKPVASAVEPKDAASKEEEAVHDAEQASGSLGQLAQLTKAKEEPLGGLDTAVDRAEQRAVTLDTELIALARDSQAADHPKPRGRVASEPKQEKVTAGGVAQEAVTQTDAIFGPGPEATPSALGGTIAYGSQFSGNDASGASGAFGTGFAGAMDFIGNVARMVIGVLTFVRGVREHDGIHMITSKDSRHGLGAIAQGAGGAFTVLIGLIKAGAGTLSKVGEFAAGPLAGGVGAVLGLISGLLTVRKALKAGKRKEGARATSDEAAVNELFMTDFVRGKGTDAKARRQDRRFWGRLRAAASLLATKSGRKQARKWIGGIGALIGSAGGFTLLLVTLGVITAANIWNPVGWALAGAALAVGIGLGIYRLVRYLRQNKSRQQDLRAAQAPSFWTGEGKESAVKPEAAGDYARFVVTELDCANKRKHVNSAAHMKRVEEFVAKVLGKKPDKVRGKGEQGAAYIADKWKSF